MRRIISAVGKVVKPIASRTFYRPGTVARIWFGPLRGLRYVVFPEYGLSHLYGGWEPDVVRVVTKYVHLGDVAYDLGANYGLHTLLLARRVGPSGRVFAFEPVPRIREALVRNVELNGFDTVVQTVPKAVSDQTGMTAMFSGHHDGAGLLATANRGHGTADQCGVQFQVEQTTLDDFVAAGHPPPKFVKIDIEGAESSALRGANHILAKHHPIILVELHSPEQDVQVATVLIQHGYTLRRVSPPTPEITDPTVGWPAPNGVWGQILGLPPGL